MTTETKHIKVNKIHYDYKPKDAESYSVAPPLPWIHLKGQWLAKAGFNIDTPIKIEIADGRLILTTE